MIFDDAPGFKAPDGDYRTQNVLESDLAPGDSGHRCGVYWNQDLFSEMKGCVSGSICTNRRRLLSLVGTTDCGSAECRLWCLTIRHQSRMSA
jgi:hypothetical protein